MMSMLNYLFTALFCCHTFLLMGQILPCNNPTFVKKYNEGKVQYEKGDYKNALTNLDMASKICPKCEDCKTMIKGCNDKIAAIPKNISQAELKRLYDDYGSFSNLGINWVRKGEKRAFIDRRGNFITKFIYDEVADYPDNDIGGYYLVTRNQKWGYINSKGEEIIPVVYDERFYYTSSTIPFAKVKKNNKYGIIDKYGTEKVSIKYEELTPVTPAGDDRFLAKLNGKYGLISNMETIVSNFQFDDARTYSSSRIRWISVKLKNKFGFIDTNGKITLPIEYDSTFIESSYYGKILNGKTIKFIEDGREFDEIEWWNGKLKVTKNNRYGLLNNYEPFVEVLKPLYTRIFGYKDGIALIQSDYETIYYVSSSETMVANMPKYETWAHSGYGFLCVRKGGKYGYVNLDTFEEITKFEYDIASLFERQIAMVKKGNETFLINTKGEQLKDKPIPYYEDFDGYFTDGRTYVKKGGKYGFINESFEEVIPCKFDKAERFDKGKAKVGIVSANTFDGYYYYYIDVNGNCVQDCPGTK